MPRSTRLFEIIQRLRAARGPQTAEALAEALEVSRRTVYRDIAALQSMGTPIEGEAGIGYVMRRGYDLPPVNFDGEEVEALRVALSMLARTGDRALTAAALSITAKLDVLNSPMDWLEVVPWGAPQDDPDKGCVSLAELRQAIREERKLSLLYIDGEGVETCRIVRPLAVIYHVEVTMLATWCELRAGFRHFRADRIWQARKLDARFSGQGDTLRSLWREQTGRTA